MKLNQILLIIMILILFIGSIESAEAQCSGGSCTFDDAYDLADLRHDDTEGRITNSYGLQIKWNVTDLLNEVSDCSKINSAYLQLYITSVSGSPDQDLWFAYIQDQAWDESSDASTLDGQTEYNTSTNSTALPAGFGASDYVNITVTTYVVEACNRSDNNMTIRIEDPDQAIGTIGGVTDNADLSVGQVSGLPANRTTFDDRESATAAQRPRLYVQYTPTNNPPAWSSNSTNGTQAGTSIEHRVYWEDDSGLAGYIFSFDNGTGSLANDSWVKMTGTLNWSNVTKHVNTTDNATIQWRVYANDSDGVWNFTGIFSYNTTTKCNPLPGYDWNITLDVTCQDTELYLSQDRSINILSGGSLTLMNTTLWINQTGDGTSVIHVWPGGAMNITDKSGDGSLINSTDSANEFDFIADPGSTLAMKHSRLEECGWSSSSPGLRINATVADFSGNTLSNNYDGVVFYSGSNTISNISSYSNARNGITFYNSSGNILTNSSLHDNSNSGISFMDGSSDNLLSGSTIYNNTRNIIFNSDNAAVTGNVVADSILLSAIGSDVHANGTDLNNNTLLNTTFDNSNVTISDNAVVYIKWYLDVYVTNKLRNPISNANVKLFDNSDGLAYSELTGKSGHITRQNVTEYFENATDRYFLTNYTLNTTKKSYTDSRQLNITESMSVSVQINIYFSFQLSLSINNTSNTVYIPVYGMGEKTAGSLGTGATYANQSHNYLASYNTTSLSALAAQRANSLFAGNTTSYHTLKMDQDLSNPKILLAFAKGDWKTIDNRIGIIESGEFFLKISPSFAFGLGVYHPIKMILNYTDIDIENNLILNKGLNKLALESNSTTSAKRLIIKRV
jgi:parallel beta-helix repeat protein